MHTGLLAAVCIAGLGSAVMSATASADALIGTTKAPTPIRSWGGVAAFSVYDEAVGSYRLAISRNSGPPEILAVAAQPTAFDLDVGPNSAGSPAIVYSRCASTGRRPRGCDLYRYSLSAGREAKLAGASSPDASETAPTIWGTRIAWARLSDARDARVPRIYTRTLSASPVASLATPGEHPVAPLRHRRLRRRRARASWAAPGQACQVSRTRVPERPDPAGVADTTGHPDRRHHLRPRRQQFVGLSFDARNLYFARFCQAGACDARVGAFRYSFSTVKYFAGPLRPAPDRLFVRHRGAGV